jgi:hypothetical protein
MIKQPQTVYVSDQESIACPDQGNDIADSVEIGARRFAVTDFPPGIMLRRNVGLVAHKSVDGQLVAVAGPPRHLLFETRATITPRGDYLLMYPLCDHYGWYKTKEQLARGKWNEMLAWRSKDKGKTWHGPTIPFDIDYNQHGFIPLIPRGSSRIYAFGTQPVWGQFTIERGQKENAPIGYRYSDDDGHTWSEVRLIRPKNEPDFRGMSVMRMCETDSGAWLIGAHEADWTFQPVLTRQYILRSEDRGATWELLPGPRHGGWLAPKGRLEETRLINLGGGRVLGQSRTIEGQLWELRSDDDGRTWTQPKPTTLVNPAAPPMLFHLSDGKTLAAFHHNRNHAARDYGKDEFQDDGQMRDRSEIWVSLSTDQGRTWGEPRFVLANALANHPMMSGYRNYQCSYLDAFVDDGVMHLFMPHRWQRALHLTIKESDLRTLPTKDGLLFG